MIRLRRTRRDPHNAGSSPTSVVTSWFAATADFYTDILGQDRKPEDDASVPGRRTRRFEQPELMRRRGRRGAVGHGELRQNV